MKILGISSILGSVNFVVTILKIKHPDLPLICVGNPDPILYDYSFHACILAAMILLRFMMTCHVLFDFSYHMVTT